MGCQASGGVAMSAIAESLFDFIFIRDSFPDDSVPWGYFNDRVKEQAAWIIGGWSE